MPLGKIFAPLFTIALTIVGRMIWEKNFLSIFCSFFSLKKNNAVFFCFAKKKEKQLRNFLFLFFPRKEKSETHLNGETLLKIEDSNFHESSFSCSGSDSSPNKRENPVSNQNRNRLQPRKQPGLYMIRCLVNDKRYYGESKNVSGRLASHKSYLNRNIHGCRELQHDFQTYGIDLFEFVVLFMGSSWQNREDRLVRESMLILQDRELCYNFLTNHNSRENEKNPFWGRSHSEETKKLIGDSMRNIPKDALGKAIQLDGQIYPSLAEASRATGMARKTIRKKLNDPADARCTLISELGSFDESPSQNE